VQWKSDLCWVFDRAAERLGLFLAFFLYKGILYFSHAQRNVKKHRISWICSGKVSSKHDKWDERFGASSSNTLLRSARLGLEEQQPSPPSSQKKTKNKTHNPPKKNPHKKPLKETNTTKYHKRSYPLSTIRHFLK